MKKKLFSILSLFTSVLFISIQPSFAQKSSEIQKNVLIPGGLKVDGELSEWADSLANYNPSAKISYVIANDNSNLYVAMKTSDPLSVRKILSFGFSVGLNKDGKKKNGPTATFPVIDRIVFRNALQSLPKGSTAKPDFSKLNKDILSKTNGIRVEGFKDLLDGNVSLNNEYGIKAAATIDDKNTFRYELAVPLSLLDLEPGAASPVAFNLRVNGAQHTVIQRNAPRYGYNPYYGYGYGYGYGEPSTYAKTISETVSFWIYSVLAQNR